MDGFALLHSGSQAARGGMGNEKDGGAALVRVRESEPRGPENRVRPDVVSSLERSDTDSVFPLRANIVPLDKRELGGSDLDRQALVSPKQGNLHILDIYSRNQILRRRYSD